MKAKILVPAALAAVVAMAFTASPAAATTLEIGGVAQNKSVATEWSLKEVVWIWRDTSSFAVNSCSSAVMKASTSSPFTGTTVGGPMSSMSWSNCTEGNPTVDAAGTISVERIGTTTNGTVRSSGAKITVPSFFGNLTCTTENTDIGTLTGVSSGTAKLDVSGVMSCTVVGTVVIIATFVYTSPGGLGVTS